MNKLLLTFTLLFSGPQSLHAMELQPDFAPVVAKSYDGHGKATQPSHTAMAGKLTDRAREYNNSTCLLTNLPNDTLKDIFSHCLIEDTNQVRSLEKTIRSFMQISMACKKFNVLLTFKEISEFCKNYKLSDKNQAFIHLTYSKSEKSDWPMNQIKRLPALILVCAGAKKKSFYLPLEAIFTNDTQLATILFKHHVNQNILFLGNPIFFQIETTEMAQLFIDHGVNIHARDNNDKHVLWYLIKHNHSSELMQLYLKHGVNPKILCPQNNDCLLHELSQSLYFLRNKDDNVENFLKTAKLLLNVMIDMINTLNKKNKTPLDIAQQSLEKAQKNGTPEAFEQLIALFKEYNGKTGKEIRELSMTLLLHSNDNLGDLLILPRNIRKHIVQFMIHYLNK